MTHCAPVETPQTVRPQRGTAPEASAGQERGFANLLVAPEAAEGTAETMIDTDGAEDAADIEPVDLEQEVRTAGVASKESEARPKSAGTDSIAERMPKELDAAGRGDQRSHEARPLRDPAAVAFALASRPVTESRNAAQVVMPAGLADVADAPGVGPSILPDMPTEGRPEGQEFGRSAESVKGTSSQIQPPGATPAARPIPMQILAALPMAEGGRTEILLSPEELGRVAMQMSIEGDSVLLSIDADRSETLDLIRRHLSELAEELQGLGYGSVEFRFQDRGEQGRPAQDQSHTETSEGPAIARAAPMTPIPIPLSAGLDLRL